ncbi:fructose-2,6-bisphosphatase [Lachnospiraceae bacterium JC7]|nr:fructose-2,6-bisphosphatase [Lachnospiraceae bacterium JC7]
MELYIVRHGETMWNRQHRLQGHTDIPLNDAGLAGARIASEALKHVHFDHVFSSPLIRARKTAEIICKNHNDLNPVLCEDLKEISFGIGEGIDLSGETITSESEKVTLSHIKDWFQDPEKISPLPGGESVTEIKARLNHFLDKEIYPNEGRYKKVLITAHGGIVRGLECIIEDLSDYDFWHGPIVPNCGALVVSLKDGRLRKTKVLDLINMT